jgi:hypothetical protein
VYAQVQLCAKQTVVDEINSIQERDDSSWEGPVINSTEPSCGVTDSPLEPRGTFTYTVEGPKFEWTFEGEGFLPSGPVYHNYILIFYPDPWPGKRLFCLDVVRNHITPDERGRLSLSGSLDLGTDLTNAKIWIVRRNWVDCSGHDIDISDLVHWRNPDGVPRLTNDRDDDGAADATSTMAWCWENGCDWGSADLAYDWLFETALINYRDTDG